MRTPLRHSPACCCPAGPPPLHLPSRLMRWTLRTRGSLSAATVIPMRRVRKTESFQKATFQVVIGRAFPYQAWTPRMLPHPDSTPLPPVIAGLQEIAAAEGPIHADRAYRLYTRAMGGHRVGPDIRRTFHKATRKALRNGRIRQLDDEIAVLEEKTLHVPGQPSILVRELGPRQLSDVPRSEVAKLIQVSRPRRCRQ